jgi:drug/metabolite transporter (DMT)-like permease
MWYVFALLAAAFYAADNTTESLIVRHYEKNPLVVTWCYGLFTILFFGVLLFFVDVHTPWMGYLIAFGMSAYLGDLFFTYTVDRLDISVVNASWPILTILLSCIGFLFFGESLKWEHGFGVFLIISGVFFLAFWKQHQHVSLLRTIGLLTVLASFFVPQAVSVKAAVESGESILPVFFWSHLGNMLPAFLVPWFFPEFRRKLPSLALRLWGAFFPLCALVVVFIIAGLLSLSWAYTFGPLSLVSPSMNVQPFLVIFYAWLLSHVLPQRAPRELLTAQSVQVKLASFTVVLIGLTLLAVG